MTTPLSIRAHQFHPLRSLSRTFALLATLLTLGYTAQAQSLTCFPNCSPDDARFLSLADASFETLSNNLIVLKLGSPATMPTIDVGIFDGETSGHWDVGTTPLQFTLYADPDGDGFGTVVVGTWSGATMPDNAWFTATVANNSAAMAPNGNFLYALHIRSVDSTERYWSNFKIRSNGSVLLKTQLFSISAVLATDADRLVVYPQYPSLLRTTYDGAWDFFLDAPFSMTELVFWDGDMDRGNYDCTDLDTDDPDTPPGVPPFATSNTRPEGVAEGAPCVNAAGVAIGGIGTGNPPDDNRFALFRRWPAINYSVLHPNGTRYANDDPSGNLEWERFRIATAPMDRNMMDYHADSLPAGVYAIRLEGMDLANLSAWRFSQDLIGVDEDGNPVPPLRPHSISGIVCLVDGSASSSSDDNGGKKKNKQKSGDDCMTRLRDVRVVLNADLNGDGLLDVNRATTTDASGSYTFSELQPGTYVVYIITSTLPSGSVPVDDYDGVVTPNKATVQLAANRSDPDNVFFKYRISSTSGGSSTGVRTQGYWKNHPDQWPVSSISIGCTTYTRAQAIQIMTMPVSGDKTYSMFVQLISAKLNVAAGATSNCIVSTISAADRWLCDNRLGSNVGGSSRAWQIGSPLHDDLDRYNNGKMCAAHLD